MDNNTAIDTREAKLEAALKTLIDLHQDWDKGRAHVSVRFFEMNNAAIAAARAALASPVEDK